MVTVPLGQSLGFFAEPDGPSSRVERWHINPEAQDAISAMKPAAEHLRSKDTPVGFPTETVYGLGADATRSSSVRGIYAAKGRPSDNPLIVHVSDLDMLRSLLGRQGENNEDVIPARYKSLVDRFWPGPLTILLPNPSPSPLAPEVTAGLSCFGVRMPSSPLALTLIKLAGVPLAAPSANASTKPSPTTAQHVKDDLDGKIELILDGGSCEIGVESTIVDGLCDPPVILRPGGVALEDVRRCPGWENVVRAYKDHSEEGKAAPRAPGMKYKHYSPKARVVLYEPTYQRGRDGIAATDLDAAITAAVVVSNGGAQSPDRVSRLARVGVIRTKKWEPAAGLRCNGLALTPRPGVVGQLEGSSYDVYAGEMLGHGGDIVGEVLDVGLGDSTRRIAQGIFSALRELDRQAADVIFVEGIDDSIDIAAAVMNRLRKAASDIRK